ncbi:uncharacterized protein LOC126786539 [Argentina anserina]|uniref:uncharacterized protein LOC126786539 n=1 Tax=Argentina anserina TaxID=57926 RepID=UPI0021766542|nr:uncharacterized protein LOC126786539 [Potentilla anserina]
MARGDQNMLIKVGLMSVSVAIFMSSFAAAEEYRACHDAAAGPTGELNYFDIPDASPPSSLEVYVFPPNLSPESYQKLEECANKIKADYADEILASILKSEPLTVDSCQGLVYLGYDCHIRLVKTLLSRPDLKEKASEALPKSLQIWDACAYLVADDQSVAPSPFY